MIIIVSRVKKALIYIILNLLLDDKEHYDFDSLKCLVLIGQFCSIFE